MFLPNKTFFFLKKEIRLFINHVKNEIDQRKLIIISKNEVSFDFNCMYFRPLPSPPPTPLRNKKDLCAFTPWIDNSYTLKICFSRVLRIPNNILQIAGI